MKTPKLLALLISLTCLAAAQAAPQPPATGPAVPVIAPPPSPGNAAAVPEATAPVHTLDAADVATFMDGLLPYALQRGDIAGGVLVIVKDGRVLFAKGYGYANVEKKIPVVADQTLFRPGSVSKLFTWTAVMQLVGAGKLDLDRDINEYLDFKLPPKFGQPITLRNLLTHTPGFEDGVSEAFVKKPEQMAPLRAYLIKHMPARIFPPGKVVAYSNYGASLAGYIVQRASGQLYAGYIADHILKPLGMLHSTFVQPLPPGLLANMSNGYLRASDDHPIPFELIETAPAGALSATATDMARFMIAHLHEGRYEDATILEPRIAQLMHSTQSKMAPGMNGFALGFYEENRNGLRIIGHAGDTTPFHSDLHLLVDKDIGVFMSFNSLGKEGEADKLRTKVFRDFLDRYFPYNAPTEQTVAAPEPDASRVAGYYRSSRRIESALRVLSAINQGTVTARPDGTIEVSALKGLSGNPKRWREVGPLTYREVGGQTHLKFVTDANGGIAFWISDDSIPVEIAQRVHGLHRLNVFKTLWCVLLAAVLLTQAIWFGGWIVRRRFGHPLTLSTWQRRLRLVSRSGALALLLMVVGWFVFLEVLTGSDGGPEVNTLLFIVYLIGVVGIAACLAIILEAAWRIARGPGGWLVRSAETLLLVSAAYGLWAILDYGMANFSFNY